MAQAVSRRPLTAVAPVRSQASPCEIGGGQSDTVTGFSPSSSVSPVSIVPPMLDTHLSSSTCCFLPEGQTGEGSE